MQRPRIAVARLGLVLLWAALGSPAMADTKVVIASGPLTASVDLKFTVSISKYVSLRVGSADALMSSVVFTVGFNPAQPGGNGQPYSGAISPPLVVTSSTTNPVTAAGALTMSAFTNMGGTQLTCSLSALGGATPLASGATAAGIPSRSEVTVNSTGTSVVAHPGGSLGGCNGTTFSAVPMLVFVTGTFTYVPGFAAQTLLSGVYGNVVTYSATTP